MSEAALLDLSKTAVNEALAGAALEGLLPGDRGGKSLPAWMFYDARGSELFEAITRLPEYYLTRTERAIFEAEAKRLPGRLGVPATLAELGAGSAAKTGILLRAFGEAQAGDLLYQPIDISPSALEEAAVSLRAALPDVRVAPQVANYMTESYRIERPAGHAVLALYIGSSIGNFAPGEAVGILRNLRAHLEAGDFLLLGVDLAPGAEKSVESLVAAYDDAAGVTAAFNKNVLVRLNREAGAEFDVDAFAHEARWNAAESRMEMHLRSLRAQTVRVGGEEVRFAAGETIHTENSYKFTDGMLSELLGGSGFAEMETMHDAGRCFAVVLARAI